MPSKTTAPLDPKIVDRLLDLLGDSDKFRELFQQDPAAALKLIGYADKAPSTKLTASSGESLSVAGCLQVAQLASKEAIQGARNELRAMLLGGLSQTSPTLDATYKAD